MAKQSKTEEAAHQHEHGHSHTQVSVDLYSTEQAFRAVKVGTLIMLITSGLEFGLVAIASSAGLLADALHNMGDVFTTLVLWVAFSVSQRQANRRYTYGYNRAEDLAGIVIVLVIIGTAIAGGWESVAKFVNGDHPTNIWIGIVGAVIGVIGNEAAAIYKIRVGREIHSVPLIADGQHSRLDGLTSAAALVGLVGAALGFPAADPIAGIIITIVIAFVVADSVKNVTGRLLDAVDPELVDRLEKTAEGVAGVLEIEALRVRWFGRNLQVSLNAEVDDQLSVVAGHRIAEEIRHVLLHQEGVSLVDVHIDPYDPTHSLYHATTSHHEHGHHDDPTHDEHHGHDHPLESLGSSSPKPI
jgi:cation diffusion facilitator family transporter